MDKFKQKVAERRESRNSDRYVGLVLQPLYESISKEFEDNLGDNIYRIINQEIPNSLINSQIIKSKDEFNADQYLQFAVTELHYELDKFDDEIQNIEGEPEEIKEIHAFLAETERRNRELIHSTLVSAEALANEARDFALQRLQAKHQEQVLQVDVKIKQWPQSSISKDKTTEVNAKFQNALNQLQQRNKRQKNYFGSFLRKTKN